jgi:16S rRNA (guanine(1405)-N(7))-methyltransferase
VFVAAIPSAATAVLDLACGLNAFALPWMGLNESTRYVPLDIDRQLAAAINRFLILSNREPLAGCLDLLSATEFPPADTVLLLKTLPSLERQEAGSAARLLDRLGDRTVLASFPSRSLGGRNRGMAGRYGDWMEEIAGSRIEKRFVYPSEIIYRLRPCR